MNRHFRAETARLVPLVVASGLLAGCAAGIDRFEVVGPPALSRCRTAVATGGATAAEPIVWAAPPFRRDRDELDAWCAGVGPPVIMAAPAAAHTGSLDLVIVTWNVHVGAADVTALVERVRAGAFTEGRPVTYLVLLLQEAYRHGALVPNTPARHRRGARAIRAAAGRQRTDVVRLADSLGLSLYYVPSMRNGAPGDTDEDRGNAVLSTLPLSDFEAIELPFERQRRVAIAATVSGHGADGHPWALRVASAHLDNLASARRLWLAATGARVRQARGLLQSMRLEPAAVLGGDLNTWFGFDDPAYREIVARLPDIVAGDRRPTFAGLFRLDHLFAQLPVGWKAHATRLDDRLGSDHHALLARIRIGAGRLTADRSPFDRPPLPVGSQPAAQKM